MANFFFQYTLFCDTKGLHWPHFGVTTMCIWARVTPKFCCSRLRHARKFPSIYPLPLVTRDKTYERPRMCNRIYCKQKPNNRTFSNLLSTHPAFRPPKTAQQAPYYSHTTPSKLSHFMDIKNVARVPSYSPRWMFRPLEIHYPWTDYAMG